MCSNLTPQTTVAALACDWLQQLRVEGRLDGTTINEYERVLRKDVVPRLGNVSLHELTRDQVNVVLAELGGKSLNRQRKAKVVTGAMLEPPSSPALSALIPSAGH